MQPAELRLRPTKKSDPEPPYNSRLRKIQKILLLPYRKRAENLEFGLFWKVGRVDRIGNKEFCYQRIYITRRTDSSPPLSYKKSTHPTSPRYVCSILHYLSVCITELLSVLRVINILFLLHSWANSHINHNQKLKNGSENKKCKKFKKKHIFSFFSRI